MNDHDYFSMLDDIPEFIKTLVDLYQNEEQENCFLICRIVELEAEKQELMVELENVKTSSKIMANDRSFENRSSVRPSEVCNMERNESIKELGLENNPFGLDDELMAHVPQHVRELWKSLDELGKRLDEVDKITDRILASMGVVFK